MEWSGIWECNGVFVCEWNGAVVGSVSVCLSVSKAVVWSVKVCVYVSGVERHLEM